MKSFSARRDWSALVQLVAEYEKGSLSQREFCAQRQITLGTFHYWRRQVRHSPPVSSGFVPVEIKTPAPAVSTVEVQTPGGYLLRVAPGFDPETLRRVLAVLA